MWPNSNRVPRVMAKILLVDDEPQTLHTLSEFLGLRGHDVICAESAERAIALLAESTPDLVITDIRLAGRDGLEVLREAKRVNPGVTVIVITGYATVETAVEAMRAGAYHYLGKPLNFDQLCLTIERALSYESTRRENFYLKRQLKKKYRFDNLIGSSPPLQAVFSLMERVADSDTTILISGESGTGKELVARALHFNSRREANPFVPINCAALPEPLLESELFGHKRGSFTGPVMDKKGLFEEAEGGTIFLDEISSLPLSLQGKLLRVLQDKEVRRVGENTSQKVNVRVLAAAQESLHEKVKAGTFREDLYYRISVISLELPPLRKLRDDIPLLAQHFLKLRAESTKHPPVRLSEEALELLLQYSWPGNVRELENALERGCALCEDNVILPKDLPPVIVAAQAISVGDLSHRTSEPLAVRSEASSLPVIVAAPVVEDDKPLHEFLVRQELAYIQRVLARYQGDKGKASHALGISLATLYRKLGSHELPAGSVPAMSEHSDTKP